MATSEHAWVELEVLAMAASGDIDVRSLRAYLTLCATCDPSGVLYLAQPENRWRQTFGAGLPLGVDHLQAWGHVLYGLEHAGLVSRYPDQGAWDEERSRLSETEAKRLAAKPYDDPKLLRVLSCDGTLHHRTLPLGSKYVWLHPQAVLNDFSTLSEGELLLLLFLLTGVRMKAFGGVDQDFVSSSEDGVTFSNPLDEIFSKYREGIPNLLSQLVHKGFFVWTQLYMSKTGRYSNKWLCHPVWLEQAVRGGTGSKVRQLRNVLMPQKALYLSGREYSFIEGFEASDYSDARPSEEIITNLVNLLPYNERKVWMTRSSQSE